MKAFKNLFLLLILIPLIFNNCNLFSTKTEIIEGYVLDDKTGLPLKGVTAFLVATGWEEYNSNILQETKTDENGYYKFTFEDERGGYELGNYGIGLPNYITPDIPHLEPYGMITVDGNEYNYSQNPMGVRIYESGTDMNFRLRPTAYFKLHFKNTDPVDDNDLVKFKPFDEPLLKMKGMNVDTIVISRRWTRECEHEVGWTIEKTNYRFHRSNEYCCPDGDTCSIDAFY